VGAEDFLVSGSNRAAVDLVDRWPDWSNPVFVVEGPERSGKSHLVQVWRHRSDAAVLSAGALSDESIHRVAEANAIAVEDIDRGISDQRVLFHLLNLTRERRGTMLVTSRCPPGDIEIALPDLRSRLRAAPVVSIGAPDEGLLKAVLIKLFADRQLMIEPHVVDHIALHMERSIAGAERVVDAADRLALMRGRRVSRPLAAEALQSVAHDRDGE
jgi:chromosomal replication initiation ATPase DnaA